jgi:hypothetical protein
MKIPDFGQASTPRPGPKIQNLGQPYHLGTQKKLAKSNRCRKNVHTDYEYEKQCWDFSSRTMFAYSEKRRQQVHEERAALTPEPLLTE